MSEKEAVKEEIRDEVHQVQDAEKEELGELEEPGEEDEELKE